MLNTFYVVCLCLLVAYHFDAFQADAAKEGFLRIKAENCEWPLKHSLPLNVCILQFLWFRGFSGLYNKIKQAGQSYKPW